MLPCLGDQTALPELDGFTGRLPTKHRALASAADVIGGGSDSLILIPLLDFFDETHCLRPNPLKRFSRAGASGTFADDLRPGRVDRHDPAIVKLLREHVEPGPELLLSSTNSIPILASHRIPSITYLAPLIFLLFILSNLRNDYQHTAHSGNDSPGNTDRSCSVDSTPRIELDAKKLADFVDHFGRLTAARSGRRTDVHTSSVRPRGPLRSKSDNLVGNAADLLKVSLPSVRMYSLLLFPFKSSPFLVGHARRNQRLISQMLGQVTVPKRIELAA